MQGYAVLKLLNPEEGIYEKRCTMSPLIYVIDRMWLVSFWRQSTWLQRFKSEQNHRWTCQMYEWVKNVLFNTQTLLTTCLYSWAVRVSQSDQCRLHQLCEEDILANQHKLSVTVAMALPVSSYAHICMLHHTVDWDHQTCQRNTERVCTRQGGLVAQVLPDFFSFRYIEDKVS